MDANQARLLLPVVGTAAAVADAGLYVAEGDYQSAALSLTAVIPGGAIISQGSRAFKALKGADEALTVANDLSKGSKALHAVEEAETVATDASRAQKAIREAEETGRGPLKYLEEAGSSCVHSFSPDTPVATASGAVPIAALHVGDQVLAYDPRTGETKAHTVDAVMVHLDPVVEHLDLDTGSLETTPNHPFFTTDRGWVEAGSLLVGEHLRTDSGSDAIVLGFSLDATPAANSTQDRSTLAGLSLARSK